MRSDGSPAFLEAMRRLAVSRLREGHAPDEVAEFLGVHRSSVYRWAEAFGRDGWAGLAAAPVPGRPPKLTARQAGRALAWVRQRSPQDLGFGADAGTHWTARRVAAAIERRWGVRFNHRYLNDWLGRHGISPQRPQRLPRERDEAAIARWLARDWPAIKRGRRRPGPASCSPTRAAC
jgi:transposase